MGILGGSKSEIMRAGRTAFENKEPMPDYEYGFDRGYWKQGYRQAKHTADLAANKPVAVIINLLNKPNKTIVDHLKITGLGVMFVIFVGLGTNLLTSILFAAHGLPFLILFLLGACYVAIRLLGLWFKTFINGDF